MISMTCRSRRMAVLVLALAVFIPSRADAGCCCPAFWTAFGLNCYRLFFVGNITWNSAELVCQSYTLPSYGDGETTRQSLGHLVSIHSQEENNFVYAYFESTRSKEGSPRLYLGLHDQSTEGQFVWTDGSAVDYTAWRPGQPDDFRSGEDCTQMHSVAGIQGSQWIDIHCDSVPVNYFICKLPMRS